MSDDAEHDTTIGQPLRDANSKFVWVDDPEDDRERIKIIVERRTSVVRSLEEHLNRNGGDFLVLLFLLWNNQLFVVVVEDHLIKVC